jgi:hypothetical protein
VHQSILVFYVAPIKISTGRVSRRLLQVSIQVYNEAKGVQKCRHHDDCDATVLKWNRGGLQYLVDNVEPQIPKLVRPYYEDMAGLKLECLKLCSNDTERNVVEKKKSIAQLEKWLRADGRTRGKQSRGKQFLST